MATTSSDVARGSTNLHRMEALTLAGAGLAVVVAGFVAIAAAGVGRLERPARVALLGLEGMAVLLVVASLGMLLRGDRPPSMVTHVGYLVAAVGIIPLILRGVPAEDGQPSQPPSLWVGAIAALVVAVVLWRMAVTA